MNSIEFIKNLKLTQDNIRDIKKVLRLSNIAKKTLFTNCKPIAIIDTGDGNFWIRDGLHRCCAILLSWRVLSDLEFVIERFSYDDIMSYNLSVKYYTPFDLKTEVRLSDFWNFKNSIENLLTEEDKIKFIQNNTHLYKTKRMDYHNSLDLFLKEKKIYDIYNSWDGK